MGSAGQFGDRHGMTQEQWKGETSKEGNPKWVTMSASLEVRRAVPVQGGAGEWELRDRASWAGSSLGISGRAEPGTQGWAGAQQRALCRGAGRFRKDSTCHLRALGFCLIGKREQPQV